MNQPNKPTIPLNYIKRNAAGERLKKIDQASFNYAMNVIRGGYFGSLHDRCDLLFDAARGLARHLQFGDIEVRDSDIPILLENARESVMAAVNANKPEYTYEGLELFKVLIEDPNHIGLVFEKVLFTSQDLDAKKTDPKTARSLINIAARCIRTVPALAVPQVIANFERLNPPKPIGQRLSEFFGFKAKKPKLLPGEVTADDVNAAFDRLKKVCQDADRILTEQYMQQPQRLKGNAP